MAPPQVLILGLGYVGTGLANRITSKHPDWTVTGTVRSPQSSTTGSKQRTPYPLDPRVATIEYGRVADHVATHGITHVLCTIPPASGNAASAPGTAGGAGHPLTSLESLESLEWLQSLQSLESLELWAGYVSTTSVYGDHGGALVDEGSLLLANGRNGACIAEERAWRECEAFEADVFRCGGIYGPYRNVLDSLVRRRGSGTASRRRGKAVTMRCHVLDVCRVIERRMVAWEEARSGAVWHGRRVYNIVDDDPIGREAVEDYVVRRSKLFADYCALEGVEAREAIDAAGDVAPPLPGPSSPALWPEKRVSNRRIKEELGIELSFPSVLDGLESIVYRGDKRPFVV